MKRRETIKNNTVCLNKKVRISSSAFRKIIRKWLTEWKDTWITQRNCEHEVEILPINWKYRENSWKF